MSFYRAILEEEITNLDYDNDSSAQVEELMEEIDDQDANVEEQAEAAEAAFGADDNVDNIVEESYIAIAESTTAWNQIMHGVAMNELNESARGREVMTESFKDWMEDAKDKIVAFFKKLWSVIQRWIGNIGAHLTTNKTFISKYASQIRKGATIYLNGNADMKSEVKGYDYKTTEVYGEIKTLIDKGNKYFTDMASVVRRHLEGKGDGEINNASGKTIGAKSFKINFNNGDTDIRDYYVDKFRGDEKTELKLTADYITTTLKDAKDVRKSAKKLLDATKKDMKAALKIIDTLGAKADSVYKTTGKDNEDSGNSTKNIRYQKIAAGAHANMRQAMSDMQIVRSVILSTMAAEVRQARRVGNLYVRLANRDENKGFRESANTEYGYLGSLNLI